MKHSLFIAAIAAVSIALFLLSNLFLFYSSQKSLANIESVKSQVSNAKSALVNFPVPDYQLTIIVSIASICAGLAAGYALATCLREEK